MDWTKRYIKMAIQIPWLDPARLILLGVFKSQVYDTKPDNIDELTEYAIFQTQ